jgi:Membrane bound O-acyl transferase family
MLVMASKSFEWTFLIKKPLRKYEWPEGQDTPVERPLSVANVLLDALDLFFNHRGIGWSWSSRPFPRKTTPPSSIASALVQTLLHFTALDTIQSILHLISSSNLLDGSLHIVPHTALVLLTTYLRGLWTYEQLESLYHIAMLIGRIFLRQPASHWPPFSHRPWMATSIRDFWSARWHQFFRHFFTVFGARPLGAVLGRPGAVMGAFGVSGLLHIVGPRRYGDMTELTYMMFFFLLMGIGMILENTFQRVTGLPVRGWFGWLWVMAWMLSWGSIFLDTRGQRGIFAVEFIPNHLRPGKILINGAISLFSQCK